MKKLDYSEKFLIRQFAFLNDNWQRVIGKGEFTPARINELGLIYGPDGIEIKPYSKYGIKHVTINLGNGKVVEASLREILAESYNIPNPHGFTELGYINENKENPDTLDNIIRIANDEYKLPEKAQLCKDKITEALKHAIYYFKIKNKSNEEIIKKLSLTEDQKNLLYIKLENAEELENEYNYIKSFKDPNTFMKKFAQSKFFKPIIQYYFFMEMKKFPIKYDKKFHLVKEFILKELGINLQEFIDKKIKLDGLINPSKDQITTIKNGILRPIKTIRDEQMGLIMETLDELNPKYASKKK